MWFDILKLDLSDLQQNLKNVDADAKAINIQAPNKCKEKLLKIIEIMKDADKKGRQALPNILEEVVKKSEYKNRDGETITFTVGDWRDEKEYLPIMHIIGLDSQFALKWTNLIDLKK